MTNHWYFKPTEDQRQRFRHDAYLRINSSKFSRWILLASVAVIESAFTGDTSQVHIHTSLMERIEGSLKAELALELAPCEMRSRWSDWIHVCLFVRYFPKNVY
jgi:hypothetical protein